MEMKLDLNDPYLLSSAGKERKKELIFEFLNYSQKIKLHGFSCPVMRDRNFEVDCVTCQKFLAMINILLQSENNKNNGKLDVKTMVEKGIVEIMVFGDGIEIKK